MDSTLTQRRRFQGLGMIQKVGGWFSEKSDRLRYGEQEPLESYYASNEDEQAYGGMRADTPDNVFGMPDQRQETARTQPIDPFAGETKDYGGRVPYKSQKDMQAEQQRKMQEDVALQYGHPQGYAQQGNAAPPQGYGQAPGQNFSQQQGYASQPQARPTPVQAQQQAMPPNNVVQFPGTQRAPNGGIYAHIEYVVLLRNRNECKNVIEHIKANASVFLNMEFIASDSERQRCVDMLSGAAYTLGCMLNRISPRGIYLISSPTVCVVMDPAIEKFSAAPDVGGFARQNYEGARYSTPQQKAGYSASAQPQPQPARAPVDYGKTFQGGEPQQANAGFAVAQTSAYQAQNTQRREPMTFGSVMAGNATGTFQPIPAYVPGAQQSGAAQNQRYKQ